MDLREFFKYHLLKALLVFIVLQLIVFALIQNYNHRPTAEKDYVRAIEGRTIKIVPLSNDSDKDELDEISLNKVSKPNNGSLEQKGAVLEYSPASGFIGVDSFAYSVFDGRKSSKEAYIVIQVNKNLAPVANRDSAVVYSGGVMAIDILGNDLDAEGDSIFIKEFTNPIYGQLLESGNKLIYVSGKSSLTDSFRYRCSDGSNSSEETSVIIGVKSKSDPLYPWLSSDIGNVNKPGSFNCKNNQIVVEASGSDIWDNYDGFRFAYQFVNGDCEIYARVESLEATHEWAKAGVMVRETLGGGSKMALVCITNRNGAAINQRLNNSIAAEAGNGDAEIKAPYWVKLIREGNNFKYYISVSGNNWKESGNSVIPMTENVYIGLAFSSHNNDEIAKAVFSNYSVRAIPARF